MLIKVGNKAEVTGNAVFIIDPDFRNVNNIGSTKSQLFRIG